MDFIDTVTTKSDTDCDELFDEVIECRSVLKSVESDEIRLEWRSADFINDHCQFEDNEATDLAMSIDSANSMKRLI